MAAVPVLPGGVLAVRLAAVARLAQAPRLAPREDGRSAVIDDLAAAQASRCYAADRCAFDKACPFYPRCGATMAGQFDELCRLWRELMAALPLPARALVTVLGRLHPGGR